MISYIKANLEVTKVHVSNLHVSMMSYIRANFREVTKLSNLACEYDVIYKG